MSRYKQPGSGKRKREHTADIDKQKIRLLVGNGQLPEAQELAVALCRRNKRDAESWFILGTIHGHLNDFQNAAECCQRAIAIRSDIPMAHYNLGIALHRLGQDTDAVKSFKTAIKLQPGFAEACMNLASTYQSLGQYPDAIDCLEKALALNANLVEARFHLGNLLAASNQVEAAIKHLRMVVQTTPGLIEAHVNLGNLLQSDEQLDEAITVYIDAIRLHPESAETHYNLGNAYRAKQMFSEAEASYNKALQNNSQLTEARINLGLVLEEQEKWPAAINCFKHAVQLNPGLYGTHSNLAHALRETGETEDALDTLNQAIVKLPDVTELRWDRSLLWLLRGEFTHGWPEYEWRWKGKGLVPRPFPQPGWDGSDLGNRTILVWAEQGIGDELMFASCFPDLVKVAGHVIIDCEPRLASLFQRSFPKATVCGNPPDNNLDWLAGLPPIDTQIPAGSLPLHLRPGLESFPEHSGYLLPDPDQSRQWQQRYTGLGEDLKIGISWRGGHISQTKKRSTTLDQWTGILQQSGASFINLQYGSCASEIKSVQEQLNITIHDWPEADPLRDLDGFAAQISALDLVISVDNSTVHMAGALGIPVWALQSFSADWRWQAVTDSSYWYPSLRQFRQPRRGDWATVFEQVEAALEQRGKTGK